MEKVVIITVTYGDRWKFLSQVVDALIHDIYLERLVIVDNGSRNQKEIDTAKYDYGSKIDIIRIGKNVGSAGGFARGLRYAQSLECDFVLLLDDDTVPEPQALRIFIDTYKSLSGRRVISGYRPDIQDASIFNSSHVQELKHTFFDIWSMEKLNNLIRKITGFVKREEDMYYPHVETRGFVQGGTLLPIEAVRDAPLPDEELVLYGDDVEYSWGVLDLGYHSYLCDRPIIRDVDMSFEEGDHILGLFNASTSPFKVYYRLRNMVRISLRNSSQYWAALHSSIFIWMLGLILRGILRYGFTQTVLSRIKLIAQAVYGGYVTSAKVPLIAQLP